MEERLTAGKGRPIQKRTTAARGWTKRKRTRFLTVLADSCNVTKAAAAAAMTASGAYQLRRRDPAFADLWAEALEIGYERLENALLEHALIGVNAIDMDEVIVGVAAEGEKGEEGEDKATSTRFAELTPGAVQLALALLKRHSEPVDRRRISRGAKRATAAETDAALKKHLDALAKKLAAATPEGNA